MRYFRTEHLNRLKKRIIYAMLAVCLLLFVIVVGGCVFGNSYGLTPIPLIAIMGAIVILLRFIHKHLTKHLQWLQKYYWAIICIGLGLLLSTNIMFGYMLRYEPIFDLGAIFTGASQWAETGSFMENINWTCDENYFYYFPNNLGGMTLLYIPFKIASVMGTADYYAVAMVTNAFLLVLTVFLTILICKKILGVCESVVALFCFMLLPPTHFMAAVFYTDTLSILFPVLTLFLYLIYLEAGTRTKRALLLIAVGFSCAIGMLVKFTVLIVLIAIVIYHFINRGSICAVYIAGVSSAVIFGVFMLFNGYMYSHYLDKPIADRLNTPYSHWIMMSLEGDGRYNPQDYEFTRSFDDPHERKEAIYEKIQERIAEKGVIGMLDLFYKKGTATFSDGTLAQSDFLDDNPKCTTFLHEFLLYDSRHYEIYQYICSGIYFSFLLLSCIAAYKALSAKQCSKTVIPILCVCGIILFLFLWEVSGRYATNYVPLIVLCAVQGITVVPPIRQI